MLFVNCFGGAPSPSSSPSSKSRGGDAPTTALLSSESWRSSTRGGWLYDDEESNYTANHKIFEHFVLEIVGAVGLSLADVKEVDDDAITAMESIIGGTDTNSYYCVVKLGDKTLHRTKTISNDTSPIWTVKTKSLALLHVDIATHQEITVELRVARGINHALGRVQLSVDQLRQGQGEREDFPIIPGQEPAVTCLALRYRQATPLDVEYFQAASSSGLDAGDFLPSLSAFTHMTGPSPEVDTSMKDNPSDVEFRNVTNKNLLEVQSKAVRVNGNEKQTAFRVWPFPDPDNPKATKFLTRQQLWDLSEQPSKQWLEAGYGHYGTVHVEILHCDDLPNMDTEYVNGLTDAFVACAFEGSFVRSSVIHDSLNPRWVPWSHRAFMFQIEHPSSILFLGVFDYDEGPLEHHDPIGRVVIHLDNFENDTVYTLKYPLYHGDTQEADHRGTVTIRLRVKWNDVHEVSKARSFVPPPRFMINVQSEKSLNVLRYMTRGSVDMTQITVQSVKLYFSELVSHWRKYCYLLDVLAEILLWRGTTKLNMFGKAYAVWFPIHSLLLFIGMVVSVERPQFIPSIILYSIAYALLQNNYHLSSHPSPWHRVRSAQRIFADRQPGLYVSDSPVQASKVIIRPEAGEKEAEELLLLDQYKMHRATGFIYEFLMTGLRIYREYSKNTPVDVSTVSKNGSLFSSLYVDYLYYIHTLFRLMCKYIRILRNFVNWNVHSTFRFTMNLMMFATVWAFFPYKIVTFWLLRISVFLCFGPWVKLLDMYWIRRYYRTKEDLLRDGIPRTEEEMKEDIARRPNILDPILKSSWVVQMSKSGRVVVENNVKLRDFRQQRYGKYSEAIPAVDTSRYPSIPLPASFAQPYAQDDGGDDEENEDCDKTVVAGTRTSSPATFDSLAGKRDSNSGNEDIEEDSQDENTEEEYRDLPSGKQKWIYLPGQKLTGTIIPQPTVRATKASCTTVV